MKKVISGVKKRLLAASLVICLILLCGLAGCAIVFPLWKWASVSPNSYTIAVFAVFLIFIAYILFRSAKRRGINAFLFRAGEVLSAGCGIFFSIYSVQKEQKSLALLILVLAAGLFTVLSVLSKKTARKNESKSK